jgi:hypothetical protein
MNISGKFGSILFSGFREEDLNVKKVSEEKKFKQLSHRVLC